MPSSWVYYFHSYIKGLFFIFYFHSLSVLLPFTQSADISTLFVYFFRVSWNWMQFYRLLNTQKLAYLFWHIYFFVCSLPSMLSTIFRLFSLIFQIINFLSICLFAYFSFGVFFFCWSRSQSGFVLLFLLLMLLLLFIK